MNTFHFNYRPRAWLTAFALSAFVVGCGSGSDGAAPAPDADPVGASCTGGDACVTLGTAGNYAVLSRAGVTNVPASVITGNVGTSPSTSITGLDLVASADGTFSTSAQVVGGGRVYAANYAEPTPTNLTTAITDAGLAFANADGKANSGAAFVNVGAGNLSGLTLAPGVYQWSTGVSVDAGSTVTLSGTATDVWVFRIAGDITMNPGATVTLTGALSQNVFWRTAGVAALNTTADLKGIVLSGSGITLATGAKVKGRLIASTSITLDANEVTRP
ncbi:MAG TPA: ice-binding family protein [Burkholderiales bacterium]|nr:ice-binding family protein [Burkholderiales bacterium]